MVILGRGKAPVTFKLILITNLHMENHAPCGGVTLNKENLCAVRRSKCEAYFRANFRLDGDTCLAKVSPLWTSSASSDHRAGCPTWSAGLPMSSRVALPYRRPCNLVGST